MEINWDTSKNMKLLETRKVCFEMVVEKILEGDFLGPEENPARPKQYRIIVWFDDYPYVVPLVMDDDHNWFPKTIYPSRKEKRRNIT